VLVFDENNAVKEQMRYTVTRSENEWYDFAVEQSGN
jgi:hypothetical protein